MRIHCAFTQPASANAAFSRSASRYWGVASALLVRAETRTGPRGGQPRSGRGLQQSFFYGFDGGDYRAGVVINPWLIRSKGWG